MQIIWADRLFIFLAALSLFFIMFIVGGFERFGMPFGNYCLMILLPTWVLLRLFDWVIGGPARRRAARNSRIEAIWEEPL